MARVTLDNVRKIYDQGRRQNVAVHGVTLDIADGEFVVLVGPSGCGKSTTLRMIAGLESISSGELRIGDRLVNDVAPKARDVAMVFQNYALYPHMTAYENLAFALVLRKLPKAEIERRVRHAAALLEIEPLLDRKPRAMSGGQRQRVALGRAIVREPAVFLFDEPLSNLDAKLRVQMRREIGRLHERLAATMIYVTHDQVEAMTLGDRIVVMNEGRVQQVDAPAALYERPANTFVATFIGSPSMNLFAGELASTGGGYAFRATAGGLVVPLAASHLPPGAHAGMPLTLGVRPEDLRVTDASAAGERPGAARLHLDLVEPIGHEWLVHASGPGLELTARSAPATLPERGRDVDVQADADRVHVFDPASGVRLSGA